MNVYDHWEQARRSSPDNQVFQLELNDVSESIKAFHNEYPREGIISALAFKAYEDDTPPYSNVFVNIVRELAYSFEGNLRRIEYEDSYFGAITTVDLTDEEEVTSTKSRHHTLCRYSQFVEFVNDLNTDEDISVSALGGRLAVKHTPTNTSAELKMRFCTECGVSLEGNN